MSSYKVKIESQEFGIGRKNEQVEGRLSNPGDEVGGGHVRVALDKDGIILSGGHHCGRVDGDNAKWRTPWGTEPQVQTDEGMGRRSTTVVISKPKYETRVVFSNTKNGCLHRHTDVNIKPEQ